VGIPKWAVDSVGLEMGKVAPVNEDDVFIASHEVLFEEVEAERCDACGGRLGREDLDREEGYSIPGRGAYLSKRGDRVEVEEAPLCASCASAIGMTALARWEIEEEEG
jgi:hypothetical protein